MRSAIFAALVMLTACKGRHDKEVVIVNNPPNQAAIDPTAPPPAGNPSPNTPPAPPASAQGSAAAPASGPATVDDQPTAPVEPAPTGGTMTQPTRQVPTPIPDAGIAPDAIDTNGLMPEH